MKNLIFSLLLTIPLIGCQLKQDYIHVHTENIYCQTGKVDTHLTFQWVTKDDELKKFSYFTYPITIRYSDKGKKYDSSIYWLYSRTEGTKEYDPISDYIILDSYGENFYKVRAYKGNFTNGLISKSELNSLFDELDKCNPKPIWISQDKDLRK